MTILRSQELVLSLIACICATKGFFSTRFRNIIDASSDHCWLFTPRTKQDRTSFVGYASVSDEVYEEMAGLKDLRKLICKSWRQLQSKAQAQAYSSPTQLLETNIFSPQSRKLWTALQKWKANAVTRWAFQEQQLPQMITACYLDKKETKDPNKRKH